MRGRPALTLRHSQQFGQVHDQKGGVEIDEGNREYCYGDELYYLFVAYGYKSFTSPGLA